MIGVATYQTVFILPVRPFFFSRRIYKRNKMSDSITNYNFKSSHPLCMYMYYIFTYGSVNKYINHLIFNKIETNSLFKEKELIETLEEYKNDLVFKNFVNEEFKKIINIKNSKINKINTNNNINNIKSNSISSIHNTKTMLGKTGHFLKPDVKTENGEFSSKKGVGKKGIEIDNLIDGVGKKGNIELGKKVSLSQTQRKWVRSIRSKNYRWSSLPKKWYELSVSNGLSCESHIQLLSWIWNKLSTSNNTNHNNDLYSVYMKNIARDYQNVIKMLIDHNMIKMICQYNNFDNGQPNKAKSYSAYKQSHLIQIAIKSQSDETDVELIIGDSEFAKWQYPHLLHISVDWRGAMRHLQPDSRNPRHLHIIRHLHMIDTQQHYCVSSSTGRIYHAVSNLQKDFRQFLRYDDQKLSNIDIRASQPSMLGRCMIDDGVECDDYVDVCKNTRIYDYLSEKYNGTPADSSYKKQFLTFLYGDYRLIQNLNIGDHIRQEWPEVYQYVYQHAKTSSSGFLARKMQEIESSVVYNISKMINTAITIHDSWLVPENMVCDSLSLINNQLQLEKIPCIARID